MAKFVVLFLSTLTLPAYGYVDLQDMAIQGDHAYVTTSWNQLVAINISALTNLQDGTWRSGSLDISDDPFHIATGQDHAYLTLRSASTAAFAVVSIYDPTKLQLVHSMPRSATLQTANDIEVVGEYAYVTWGDALTVLSVADPAAPQILGFVQDPLKLKLAGEFALQGNYAYVTTEDMLTVVDVSDPASPSVKGSAGGGGQWASFRKVRDIVVSGSYACVVTKRGILTIIDIISDPVQPLILGTSDDPRWFRHYLMFDPTGLAVVGTMLYVSAKGSDGLAVVNISDPGNLRIVGSVQDTDRLKEPEDVQIVGNYAYMTSDDTLPSGEGKIFTVVEISDATNPQLVASNLETPWTTPTDFPDIHPTSTMKAAAASLPAAASSPRRGAGLVVILWAFVYLSQ